MYISWTTLSLWHDGSLVVTFLTRSINTHRHVQFPLLDSYSHHEHFEPYTLPHDHTQLLFVCARPFRGFTVLTLGSYIPHNCFLYVSNIPYPRVGHAGTQAYWKDASIPSCFWIPDFPILIMSANQCDTTIREHFEYSFIRIPISQSPFLGMYKPS